MSRNANWVLQCIGIYQEGYYLDDIESHFEMQFDMSSDETIELVRDYAPNVGNRIAELMYEKIIERAVNQLCASEDDFDYICNGTLDTHLYYKKEEVSCWEDIVELNKQK